MSHLENTTQFKQTQNLVKIYRKLTFKSKVKTIYICFCFFIV